MTNLKIGVFARPSINKSSLIQFVGVLLLASSFLSACSDDSTSVDKQQKLHLESSATQIAVGHQVSFLVTANGIGVNGADMYVDSSRINGLTYTFNEAGTHTAMAKKEGYTNSIRIKIDVSEEPQLHLQASDSTINAGDDILFKVTATGCSVDADIYVDSSRINGLAYTFNEVGSHTAIAKKEGYANSKKVKINVSSANGKPPFRDVYVAGTAYFNHVSVATYWKNSTPHQLANHGTAQSIFVDEGNVYVAGSSAESGVVYWKNGTLHKLADRGAANSMYVTEGDVYVAGVMRTDTMRNGTYDEISKIVYWKNGKEHDLTDWKFGVKAHSIYVTDGDVYVAGTVDQDALYWKNGTPHHLADFASAHSIYVSDGDVYVAGSSVDRGVVYWKNGTPHKQKITDNIGTANSIYVTDGDVYLAGTETDGNAGGHKVIYWKNGILHKLANNGVAGSIYISDGDVYVAGAAGDKAMYWKNGNPHWLTDGTKAELSDAFSIFVVKTKVE